MEVEIGIGKSGRRAYGLDDIAIVPSRRTRDPEDVDISWELDAFRFDLPVIAAAMDSARAAGAHPKAALIESLAGIASEAGMDIDELAIRWVTAHAGISAVLLGMSSNAHLTRNLDLLRRPPMDDALMRRVAEATTRTAGVSDQR